MQTRTLADLATIALFAAPAVPGELAQAQQRTNQPPNYYVINLGDPLGGPSAGIHVGSFCDPHDLALDVFVRPTHGAVRSYI